MTLQISIGRLLIPINVLYSFSPAFFDFNVNLTIKVETAVFGGIQASNHNDDVLLLR